VNNVTVVIPVISQELAALFMWRC